MTLDKLEVTRRLCPRISKLDISMFNFSFDEQEFLIGLANDEAATEQNLGTPATSLSFEFKVPSRNYKPSDNALISRS